MSRRPRERAPLLRPRFEEERLLPLRLPPPRLDDDERELLERVVVPRPDERDVVLRLRDFDARDFDCAALPPNPAAICLALKLRPRAGDEERERELPLLRPRFGERELPPRFDEDVERELPPRELLRDDERPR